MNDKINAIILDVDGVIVGEKIGYNSPNPHPEVTNALREIKNSGISICLCTAKPHYSLDKIIIPANLNNPHITDAGALVINPINNEVINSHFINSNLTQKVLNDCLKNNIYVEFYTSIDYFVQQDKINETTKIHTHILQRKPKLVLSLFDESIKHDITKIMPIARDESHQKEVDKILSKYNDDLSISWGIHPVALPKQFGIITSKLTSKKDAALSVLKFLNIDPKNTLGIGDSTSDWKFIELCGYAATVFNGSKEIQEFVSSKGEKHFIGKSVDENGFLDIANHFFGVKR